MTGFIKPIRLLSNFTAGAMLLLFQPFKVGDLIEADGTFGTVEEIGLLNTIIITPENRYIRVPNTRLTSDKMSNYSAKGMLRLELLFGVGDNHFLKIKPILKEMLNNDARILNNPAPTVVILEAADNRVNFAVRPYVKVEDYWDVHLDLMEEIKQLFFEEGISASHSAQTEEACPNVEFAKACCEGREEGRVTPHAAQNNNRRRHKRLNPRRRRKFRNPIPSS